MSFFKSITRLPDDPIMTLPIIFAADSRPHKVNLGIGSYKDENGKPVVLSSVHQAETALITLEENKEYLPIEGDPALIKATTELILGPVLVNALKERLFCAQTVGGTNALRLGSDFLLQETSRTIFIPTPTWSNHLLIFKRSGMNVHHYRYYDEKARALDFSALKEDIEKMPSGSILLLHAICHNPTGIDPTIEQWKELSLLIKQKHLLPFFDLAYQGFGIDLETDAQPIRYFAEQGHEMLIANSFAKNFGLYGERVGTLTVITQEPKMTDRIGSQLKQIIRAMYSNPPRHGASIIAHILNTPNLKTQWIRELTQMRDRMEAMREQFISGLQACKGAKDWKFLKNQHGFFSFCGLTPEQVSQLIEKYAIHMPSSGRINMAGLNPHNIDYVINAIHDIASK